MDNQRALSWGYKTVMMEHGWQMLAPRLPLYIKWKVIRTGPRYKVDFDNCLKALVDAAQSVVFENDKYILRDLGGLLDYGSPALVQVEFGLVEEL